MPYISKASRQRLDKPLEVLSELIDSRGDLNYCITALVSSRVGSIGYAALEQAIGVLECAKMEFYRRVGAPYEDLKRQENGDVYYADDLVEVINDVEAGKDQRMKGSAVAP